ncbi:MAG: 4,5-DOPA dioxygenase extradiol [Nitrosomonas sp.]|nr:MAG: 4,5-DOPA dioxygenase extradiol [Nitrosomonas sp.]
MKKEAQILPAMFIGHGSPMNTLELNRYTRAWRKIGEFIPNPRAILVVSAHWYFGATAVTAMLKPRTIHDFYGFPEELFEFTYPAPGMPELVDEIAEIVKPHWIGADRDQWGLDHGTWSILAHLYPKANIPVLQLSINAFKPLAYHIELGAKLSQLRNDNILVIGSGNVVHNLKHLNFTRSEAGEDWAKRFDEAVVQQMSESPEEILRVVEHQDFKLSVPTPEHFIPLLYLAGLSSATNENPCAFLQGYTYGSLSMTSYSIGLKMKAEEVLGSAVIAPTGIPADQTNI